MTFKQIFERIVFSLLLVLGFFQSKASHILGGEIFYTYVSGNTYNVSMIIYGDCSGTAAAFQGLTTATPQIEVYNGASLVSIINLQPQSGAGTLVSPVCPDEINNTTCTPNGTLPGVKKYVYTTSYNVVGSSANWKFRFTGQLINNTQAGRSNNITNVIIPGAGSLMSLEATLNNTFATNSSPTYTTIPTPFFCINKPQEYNQGAVDPNGDVMTFSLVPGLDASTTPSTNVTYIAPFTAVAPLGTTPGTYVFNGSTGQLSFTPNIIQRALVVSRVSEFRNGVLIGTSMREMTFVVLNNCNNNPPDGVIGSVVNATMVNASTVSVCKFNGSISFSINASDLDGDNVTLSTQGLPTGAVTNMINNATPNPTFTLSWDISNVAPGTYTFYLTFTDDGCPVASKQTKAFSIIVAPIPNITAVVSPVLCFGSTIGSITINGSGGTTPYNYALGAGVFTVNNTFSNLGQGTYLFHLKDTYGCLKDTSITLVQPTSLNFSLNLVPVFCFGQNTGSVTINAGGGTPSYQYAIGTGAFQANNQFSNLAAGTYIIHLKDANNCTKDTSITIVQPSDPMTFSTFSLVNPTCQSLTNGSVTLVAQGGIPNYQYAIGTQPYSATNTFTGLGAGTYVLHVRDAILCVKDTTITIIDPPQMILNLNIKRPVCSPVTNGQVIVGSVTNGTSPYQYAINTGIYSNTPTFSSLAPGTYTIHVKDANNCIKDSIITLIDSMQMTLQAIITPIQCFGNTNGIITLTASGTTPAYTYALGTGTFAATNVFNNLGQGTYILHAKDANGCLKDTTIALVQPNLLTFTLNTTNVSCKGGNNGTVTVNAIGGTPAYQYAFDGNAFQPGNTLTGLNAGTHIIHLKDDHNCVKDSTITITEPLTAIAFGNFNIITPTCESFTDGSVALSANGGTPPYKFSINNGTFVANANFGSIAEGTYIFKAKDNNGCEIDTTITLTGFPHILINGASFTLPTCNGEVDGKLSLNVSGGKPPFMYNIDNGNTWNANPVFSDKASGNYKLSVRDDNGCIKDTLVFLPQPDRIGIDTSHIGNDCNGVDNGGVITILVNGGTAPFQYNWSHDPELHLPKITGLVNGVYTVEVIDANGCTENASVEILYNNCCTPFIPNAFSPNGDSKNDYYRVEYKGDMELKEMYVYNRFGQRVFSSSNVNKTWDGTFNGTLVDGGTYFYYVRILCGNVLKKELIFKGDVTVIR